MKYLHDDRLAELTSVLTDCPVGGAISTRVLHGRLEAYTMKRGSHDKKYATQLGAKYVASLELVAQDNAAVVERRSTRKRSQSAGQLMEELLTQPPPKQRKSRASSFDDTSRSPKLVPLSAISRHATVSTSVPSDLGDFAEQGTRRLMTDLILTLNMSFPDFDFAAVRPTDFTHLPLSECIDKVNKLLSDLALRKETFLSDLWTSLDQVMHLADCEIYSYEPRSVDQDDDPMAFLDTLMEDSHHRSSTPKDSDQEQPATIWTFNYFFVNKTLKRIVLFTCVESMHASVPETTDEEEFASLMPSVGDTTDVDFDLDPAATPAGGIPISSI